MVQFLSYYLKNGLKIGKSAINQATVSGIQMLLPLDTSMGFKWIWFLGSLYSDAQCICYKVIQQFRVTWFIAGQYDTGLLWHITGI